MKLHSNEESIAEKFAEIFVAFPLIFYVSKTMVYCDPTDYMGVGMGGAGARAPLVFSNCWQSRPGLTSLQ